MALHIQLELFDDPNDETLYLKRQIDTLVTAQDKMRKALFARNTEMERNFSKQMFEFNQKLDAIERQLMIVAKASK